MAGTVYLYDKDFNRISAVSGLFNEEALKPGRIDLLAKHPTASSIIRSARPTSSVYAAVRTQLTSWCGRLTSFEVRRDEDAQPRLYAKFDYEIPNLQYRLGFGGLE